MLEYSHRWFHKSNGKKRKEEKEFEELTCRLILDSSRQSDPSPRQLA